MDWAIFVIQMTKVLYLLSFNSKCFLRNECCQRVPWRKKANGIFTETRCFILWKIFTSSTLWFTWDITFQSKEENPLQALNSQLRPRQKRRNRCCCLNMTWYDEKLIIKRLLANLGFLKFAFCISDERNEIVKKVRNKLGTITLGLDGKSPLKWSLTKMSLINESYWNYCQLLILQTYFKKF